MYMLESIYDSVIISKRKEKKYQKKKMYRVGKKYRQQAHERWKNPNFTLYSNSGLGKSTCASGFVQINPHYVVFGHIIYNYLHLFLDIVNIIHMYYRGIK